MVFGGWTISEEENIDVAAIKGQPGQQYEE